MDVLVLIDKLDDVVHNARTVPLTDQVRIDREEIYDILDQMRATIPEEIKQARWIVKERQEMLAEAKRECDRMLGEAREQAVREASQTEIVKLAERQAQDIIDESRRQARETKLEMEDWADNILSTLEVNLEKFLTAHPPRARATPRALAGDRRRGRRRGNRGGRLPALALGVPPREDPVESDVSVALPGLALRLVHDLDSRLDDREARLSNEPLVRLLVEAREEHRRSQKVVDDGLVRRTSPEGREEEAIGP